LLAAEGMVCLAVLSLDGTKLAGNASQKANKTLPQIEKLLAEAAAADAAEDARHGSAAGPVTPRALARRAERRQRLAAAVGRFAAEDQARRDVQRAKQEAWDAAAAAGNRRGHRPAGEPPRPNRNNTAPRANITDPDVRIMRNQKGYVAGYNGPACGHRPAGHRRRGAVPAPGPAAPCCTRCWAPAASNWPRPGSSRSCAPCSPTPATSPRTTSLVPTPMACGCSRRWPKTPACAAAARVHLA
jgi:hypothetical protein